MTWQIREYNHPYLDYPREDSERGFIANSVMVLNQVSHPPGTKLK
jgi:hypothetical protein